MRRHNIPKMTEAATVKRNLLSGGPAILVVLMAGLTLLGVQPVLSRDQNRLMVIIDWGDRSDYPHRHLMVVNPADKWLEGTITDDKGTHRVLFLEKWRQDGRLVNWIDSERGPQHIFKGDAGKHQVTIKTYYRRPTSRTGHKPVSLEDGTMAYVEEMTVRPPAAGLSGGAPQNAADMFVYGQDTPFLEQPGFEPQLERGDRIAEDRLIICSMSYRYPSRNPETCTDFHGEWKFIFKGPGDEIRWIQHRPGLVVEYDGFLVPSSSRPWEDRFRNIVVPQLHYGQTEPGLSSVIDGLKVTTKINYYVEMPDSAGGAEITLCVEDMTPPSLVRVDMAGQTGGTTGDPVDRGDLVIVDNNPNLRAEHVSAHLNFLPFSPLSYNFKNEYPRQVIVVDPGAQGIERAGDYGVEVRWRLPESFRLPLVAKGRLRPLVRLQGFGPEEDRVLDESIIVYDNDPPNIYVRLCDERRFDRWYTDPAATEDGSGTIPVFPENYRFVDGRPRWEVRTGNEVFEKTRLLVEVYVIDNILVMDGLPLEQVHLNNVSIRLPGSKEIHSILPQMKPRGDGVVYHLKNGLMFRSPGTYEFIVEARDRARSLGGYGERDNHRQLALTINVQDTRLRHDNLE